MIIWRALLADGRVVTFDGSNSPQSFLNDIIEFQLIQGGSVLVRVQPDKGERVIYRRRNEGFKQFTTCHIVGIVNLEHGLASLCELGEDGVLKIGFVPEVEFTAAEVA